MKARDDELEATATMTGTIQTSAPPSMGFTLTVAVFSVLILGACGGRYMNVEDEKPLVRLDSLSRESSGLVAGVSIRNINDSPMELNVLELDLYLAEQSVRGGKDHTFDLNIAARGREVIEFRFDSGEQDFSSLDDVSTGSRANLPWSMTLYQVGQNRRNVLAEAKGFLHPVPGQPDRFR